MILSKTEVEELSKIVDTVLERMYKEDKPLIESGGQERSLSFIFGLYFSQFKETLDWLNSVQVDLEYNKNGLEPKRTPRRPNGVVPDFILHQRGNNENNMLVIEFKGWWNNSSGENDIIKLEDFIHQEGEYKYGLGYLIEFNKDRPESVLFKGYDLA